MTPVRDQSLHTLLWIGQLLLAALFALTGFMKLTMPLADLAQHMVWTGDVPPILVRFTGAAEMAGAIGLVLPALTGIQPGLTPLAAAGLTVLMALASIFHVGRGEIWNLEVTVPLCAAAAFVAWGRLTRAPLTLRLRA